MTRDQRKSPHDLDDEDQTHTGIRASAAPSPYEEEASAKPDPAGEDGEPLGADPTAAMAGQLVRRFRALWPEDQRVILLDVSEALRDRGGRAHPGIDPRLVYELLAVAQARDLRRWAESKGRDELTLRLELERGRRRVEGGVGGTLHRAAWLLDAVALEDEEPKVVMYLAIAYGKSREAVYKHLNRAWQCFCGDPARGAEDRWDTRWREISRHLFDLTLAHVAAARAYLDVCAAAPALTAAVDEVCELFFRRKILAQRAAGSWSELRRALDAYAPSPAEVADDLRAHCADLGIDDRVPHGGLSRLHTWAALLRGVGRPSVDVVEAWPRFLIACGVDLEGPLGDALRTLAEDTRAARAAKDAVKPSYRALLETAREIPAWCDARDNLLCLVGRSTKGEDDEA